jgi:adenine-specific DNA-methyltransferase
MLQLNLLQHTEAGEDPAFLQEQIITYIGNKRSLLPFIGQALRKVQKELARERLSVVDLFSGTGVVARYLKRFSDFLIVNDLEAYSKVTNQCYLTNRSSVDQDLLAHSLQCIEAEIASNWVEGFICKLYSPKDESAISETDRVFYTRRNAGYLDSARLAISKLPASIQMYFIAPLIAKASVHANTSGVFKGFYKNKAGVGQFGGSGKDALSRILGEIQLNLPIFSRFECDYEVHQQDANVLAQTLPEVDVAYFDPPYNQHPYGSNYFMLNLLVDYKPPMETSRVSGIPTNWNRSRYNQRAEAAETLFHAIASCPARFILISYNSEGFVTHEQFITKLRSLGRLDVCETTYNTFRGSRNLRQRSIHVTEFLYLIKKY